MNDGTQEFYAPDEVAGRPRFNAQYLLTQVVTGDRNLEYGKQHAQTDSIALSLKEKLTSLSPDQIIDYTTLVLSRLSDDTKDWKDDYTQRALNSLRILTYETLTESYKTTLFNSYKDTIQDLTPDYDYLRSVTDLMKAGEILFKDYPEERKQILNTAFEALAVAYQSSASKNKNKYKNTVGGTAAAYIRNHNPFKTPDISEVVQEEPQDRIVKVEEYATDLDWLTYSELSSMINDLKKASGKVSVISPTTVKHPAQTVLKVLRLIEGEEMIESKYLLIMRARGGRRHWLPHVSPNLIKYIKRLPSLNEPPEGWVGVQELITGSGNRDAIYRQIRSKLENPTKAALKTTYPQFANDEAKMNLAILWERMHDPEFGQYGEFKNPETDKPALYISPAAAAAIRGSIKNS